MGEAEDWRLRAELADPAELHARLRSARHFEHEVKPLVADDVVLSYDEEMLFAYAKTREAITRTREAIEHQLAKDGLSATLAIAHWERELEDWHQVEPPLDDAGRERESLERRAADEREANEARVETRTVAITSGRMVRNWFETTVADEARALGVELSIVEHPHLLTTQIAFTLTGPSGKIDELIADLHARAGAATQLESAYITPI
jgi:hypothetical protein